MTVSMFEERNFVLMRSGSTALLFPQYEVIAVEALNEVRWGECARPALGTLALNGQELPVYAVTEEIKLTGQPQGSWRFCLCLTASDKPTKFALACSNVEQYRLADNAAVMPLPAYMRTAESPLRGLVRLHDELGLVCTMASMQGCIEAGEQRYG